MWHHVLPQKRFRLHVLQSALKRQSGEIFSSAALKKPLFDPLSDLRSNLAHILEFAKTLSPIYYTSGFPGNIIMKWRGRHNTSRIPRFFANTVFKRDFQIRKKQPTMSHCSTHSTATLQHTVPQIKTTLDGPFILKLQWRKHELGLK